MYTAEEALARLVAGNDRFVRGEARFPSVRKEVLAELAKGQRPYATIIGCSDSRVPPELVFDAGFGELFIVRIAGNVDLTGNHGDAAVRGGASAHAAFRGARSRKVWCGPGCAGWSVHNAREHARIALLLDNMLPGLRDLNGTLRTERPARRGSRGERALVDASTARHA